MLTPQNDRRFSIAVAAAALMALLGPAAASAVPFDFALDRLEVVGAVNFVDDFDDGVRNGPPTSSIVDQGMTVTSESGGFLQFSDTNGSNTLPTGGGTISFDAASLTPAIPEAFAGTTSILATWRADVPLDATGQSGYSLVLDDPSTSDLEAVFLSVRSFDFGPGVGTFLLINFQDLSGTFFGSEALDPALVTAASTLTLALDIDHATGAVLPRYQLDNGAFVAGANWSTPATAMPTFLTDTSMFVQVAAQGFVPEPGIALMLVTATIGFVARNRRP